jgi:hypothetical protein
MAWARLPGCGTRGGALNSICVEPSAPGSGPTLTPSGAVASGLPPGDRRAQSPEESRGESSGNQGRPAAPDDRDPSDQAFHFRYPEAAELLEAEGLQVRPWSPLADEPLPALTAGPGCCRAATRNCMGPDWPAASAAWRTCGELRRGACRSMGNAAASCCWARSWSIPPAKSTRWPACCPSGPGAAASALATARQSQGDGLVVRRGETWQGHGIPSLAAGAGGSRRRQLALGPHRQAREGPARCRAPARPTSPCQKLLRACAAPSPCGSLKDGVIPRGSKDGAQRLCTPAGYTFIGLDVR